MQFFQQQRSVLNRALTKGDKEGHHYIERNCRLYIVREKIFMFVSFLLKLAIHKF